LSLWEIDPAGNCLSCRHPRRSWSTTLARLLIIPPTVGGWRRDICTTANRRAQLVARQQSRATATTGSEGHPQEPRKGRGVRWRTEVAGKERDTRDCSPVWKSHENLSCDKLRDPRDPARRLGGC